MRRAVFAFVLLAWLPLASWSQPESGSIVRDPHSTPADLAVPLCPAKFDDSLESNGIAGGHDKGLIPPKVTFTSEARITDEARKLHHMSANVTISFVLDEKGKANSDSVCIAKSAGYGLDASAAKSPSESRFKPARADGRPVPYRVTMDVQFRTYF